MSDLVSEDALPGAAPEPSMAARPLRRPGVLGRLVRDPVGLAALVVVVLIVALALLSPVLSPTNPADNNLTDAMAPFGAPGLPLGADAQGRNMVTRMLFGLRLTLVMGVVAVLAGGTVGALIGFAAAFWRRVDGQPARFTLFGIQTALTNGMAQAVQADLRRVGIDMHVQLWDATVAWGKLATQEFDAFVMSYPYLSATDALSLYFPSSNRPTPNRMNWVNADTDKWILGARTATDPATRAKLIGEVEEKITEANVWVPLVSQQLWVMSAKRVEGLRPNGVYGAALYKGLDIRLTH